MLLAHSLTQRPFSKKGQTAWGPTTPLVYLHQIGRLNQVIRGEAGGSEFRQICGCQRLGEGPGVPRGRWERGPDGEVAAAELEEVDGRGGREGRQGAGGGGEGLPRVERREGPDPGARGGGSFGGEPRVGGRRTGPFLKRTTHPPQGGSSPAHNPTGRVGGGAGQPAA